MNVSEEVYELRGVFPDVTRSDFYELNNGNVGVLVDYSIEDHSIDRFVVLIEYIEEYPSEPPRAWISEPEIEQSCPHIMGFDENGHAQISYADPNSWDSNYTSFDAAVMIKWWVYAYCNWVENGVWDWNTERHGSGESLDGVGPSRQFKGVEAGDCR